MRALVQPAPVYLHAVGMALFATVLPVFMTSGTIHHIGSSRTALIGTRRPHANNRPGCLAAERAAVAAGRSVITGAASPGHKRWQTLR